MHAAVRLAQRGSLASIAAENTVRAEFPALADRRSPGRLHTCGPNSMSGF